MRRIKCYIVDDEQHGINQLSREISKIPTLDLVGAANDAKEALRQLTIMPVDLVFLDINMEGISGLEFIKMVDMKVIFTTADKSRFDEALDHENALDYLVKPILFPRLVKAIKKTQAHFAGNGAEKDIEGYRMKTSLGMANVAFEQIDFIKAGPYYASVHYSGKVAKIPMQLSGVMDILPKGRFARVHKSFIVNISKVKIRKYDELILLDDNIVPLGQAYKSNLDQ